MGYMEPDVYMQPEHFGLETVGTVSWDDEPYQFDLTIVLRDRDGRLYWASDSGCSCPSPFEDFTSIEDLRTGTVYQLIQELTDRCEGMEKVVDLLARIKMETAA